MADGSVDQRAERQPPLLVFIHIPKTAGTTLTTVLNMNEPGERIRRAGNVFRGGGGTKEGAQFEGLRNNEWSSLRGVSILTGHFPLGIREYLPKDRDLRYFTFLREPTDRTLSHYFAIRQKHDGSPEHAAQKFVLSPLPAEPTLDDALEAGYLHDNLQTRMLSGLPEPFGEVTDAMLEQAKHNLREELAFFGLTERFDESLVLAKQRLGLRSILYSSAGNSGVRSRISRSSGRVNTTRPRGTDVPAELVEAAECCNRYDIELYRYAQELFDSAPERAELDFQVELAALGAAKVDGEIELEAPPPAGFGGDEEAWRMLLYARAALLREEREFALFRRRRLTPGSAAQDGTKNELEAARARGKELEKKVRRLEAARARSGRKARSPKKARTRQPSTPVAGAGGEPRRQSKATRNASRRKPVSAKPRRRAKATKSASDPPEQTPSTNA